MDKKIKQISYVGIGPLKEEILTKDINKECTRVSVSKDGEIDFCCTNQTEPYKLLIPPFAKPISIWISQAMLCKECLDELSVKYDIDFKKNIPLAFLDKGWLQNEDIDDMKLIKDMKSKIHTTFIDVNSDPEYKWWNDINFLQGLPKYWIENFELLETTLKRSSEQGKFNGPDFIFKDEDKTIGFEITSYKWNLFTSFNDEKYLNKFSKEKMYNATSLDDELENIKKLVREKSKKKYKKTDELYLGICFNDTIVDYIYYVLEPILNKFIKDEELELDGVFIL